MEVKYNHHSQRAIKARFSRFFTKKTIFLLESVCIILLIGILLLIVTEQYRLAGLIGAVTIDIVVLLLWHAGDLSKLTPRKHNNSAIVQVDELLDREVLAKLPANPTTMDVLSAVKKHFHWTFFKVRFGLSDEWLNDEDLGRIEVDHVWEDAFTLSQKFGHSTITPASILVTIFLRSSSSQDILNNLKIDQNDLITGVSWLKHLEDTYASAKARQTYGGIGRDWAAGYTPLLNRIGHNISADIQRGGFWTRETDSHNLLIDQLIKTLSKSRTSSVALVGDVGVGKTTAVHGLARKLLIEKVEGLRYHQIFTLDASTLIANSGNNQSLEQLLIRTFNEAATAGNIILFLDEAHLFMSEGTGAVNLTNVLSQVLQSGRVRMILSMTPKNWQLVTTQHANLAGLLNYQIMQAPPKEETIQIMQDQLITIEHKNNVVFTHQAVEEAYRLAEKYIHEQEFPGRGIQLLEETAVFANSGLITAETVGNSIESKLGVKVVQATAQEGQKLLSLEDELHKQMINQTRAVNVVSDALRRARSGVSSQNRPTGTFLFLGPTGVGKTELAKALASVYFSGRDQIIRVNLNEYSQPTDAARLLQAVGENSGSNSLLAQIRRQPYSVVLLDEIEKAHPEVLNVLLQLLDEGVLRDQDGKEASFKDSIVIATSNAGADTIRQQVEAGRDLEEFEKEFINQLIDSSVFRPEFLNRFDEVVLFRPLKPDELAQVVRLMLKEVNQNLARQKVHVTLTDVAVAWLVQEGNDPRLGARPMRRMIQRSVENLVAKKILEGTASAGSEITIDVTELQDTGK